MGGVGGGKRGRETALSADEEGAGQDRGRTERTLVLTPSEYSRRNLGGLNLTANRLGWNGASISHPLARTPWHVLSKEWWLAGSGSRI